MSEKHYRSMRKETRLAAALKRLEMLESVYFEREMDIAQGTAIGDEEATAQALRAQANINIQRTAVEELISALTDEEEPSAEPSA